MPRGVYKHGPHSAETRAKQSATQKGRKRPDISANQKGRQQFYRKKFMKAIGQARHYRSQPMNAVEQAFYDGLVTTHGQGEVMREVPFGPYIVDFYVPKLHLAYELDGQGHERLYHESDRQRDAWLLQCAGLPVSRVKRSEVETAMEERR